MRSPPQERLASYTATAQATFNSVPSRVCISACLEERRAVHCIQCIRRWEQGGPSVARRGRREDRCITEITVVEITVVVILSNRATGLLDSVGLSAIHVHTRAHNPNIDSRAKQLQTQLPHREARRVLLPTHPHVQMYEEGAFASHPLHYNTVLGGLFDDEYFWRNHSKWLADLGYKLRPRYQEDWQPSWLKDDANKHILECEDGESTMVSQYAPSPLLARSYSLQVTVTMDAVRIFDGRIVSLKKTSKKDHPVEEDIVRYLNQAPSKADPTNHTVPVYDVLQSPLDPDCILLVMPYLARIYTVKFATVGEAVECFRQLFEVSRLTSHRS